MNDGRVKKFGTGITQTKNFLDSIKMQKFNGELSKEVW